MSVYPTGIVLGVVLLLVVVELLRRHRLREKYAALWLFVGLGGVAVAVFPALLTRTASALGFEVPANMLFLVGMIALVAISMQLSLEVGRLESEGQRLAEELALLRLRLDDLELPHPAERPSGSTSGDDVVGDVEAGN